jgi:tetratricopeptide (TPR) repeat protein
MDDDEPEKAEEELLSGLARLEEIEARLSDLGLGVRDLARVRNERASALVTLAVNANVKQGDTEKALRYFEQAFELRQDDFMRVLLACYRARDGKAEEAREILAEVTPTRALYYNLACTYALLGERERALELLEKELGLNHRGTLSLERQKEWARADPDLESLRDDPRFLWLVGEQ